MPELVIAKDLPAKLIGRRIPNIPLESTEKNWLKKAYLAEYIGEAAIVGVFPLGVGFREVPPLEWTEVEAIDACMEQNRELRNKHHGMKTLGINIVALSVQTRVAQLEFAQEMNLPFPLLSDPGVTLAEELGLPTFRVGSCRYYQRLLLFCVKGKVAGVAYPVSDPKRAIADMAACIHEALIDRVG
ncbi:MAG: redoxin domain-containing protein [Candidatus Pacebacteria bacterium]|nr:redoxin domain-containing protein [Candidatus Paceibacterota bacterium]MDD5357508.1 redoxin domain-containing protein [Candidatus Paceibacterota bacterium]